MLRATWASLMARKVRLLLSTLAVVLGVAFVAGSLIFTDTLQRSFTALFDSSVGDVVVAPRGGDTADGNVSTRTLPASLVDRLAEVPGAARADGNVSATGVYVVDKRGKAVGGFGPPGLGGSYSDAPAANGGRGLSLVRGAAPTRAGEVALDQRTAERAGYRVGDRISVVTPSPRDPVVRARLVGLVGFPDGGSLNGASVTVFDVRTAQQLFLGGKDAFNDIWVSAAPGVSQDELARAVRGVAPADAQVRTGDAQADAMASDLLQAISFITVFLLVFAGIALVVGSFLIVNTFSILLAQRSRELALLRALGATRRQVTRSVMLEALAMGIVGSTLGLAGGVVLAMGIRSLFGRFGLDLAGQSLVFAPRTPIAAYAVGVVVTVAAGYLPARRAARVAPVAALRDDDAVTGASVRTRSVLGLAVAAVGLATLVLGLFAGVPRPVWFVGVGVLLTLLGVSAAIPVVGRPVLGAAAWVYVRAFGAVGRLAGQNAGRNPRRTAATASALMIGLALVTTMAVAGASAKASVDQSISSSFAGDAVLSNITGQPFSARLGRQAADLPQVAAVSPVRFAYASIKGGGSGLVAATPAGLRDELGLRLSSGSFADLRQDTVLLQDSEAKAQGLAVGDVLTAEVPEGTRRLRVVGTFEPNPLVFLPRITTLGTLESAGYPVVDNLVLVQRAGGATQRDLLRSLDRLVADVPTVTVRDQAGLAADQRAPIDQLLSLVYALLGLALVIAALGVVNTLALSVMERTREIGLLRAVGLGRRQLRSVIALESVAIAVLGTVVGMVLGVVFGVSLMTSLRDEGLEVVAVPVGQLVVFVVVAVVVGLAAPLLPARRAARLDVLSAIATE